MNEKKIILIDPHADDFIFKPISFLIGRRKPLQKYAYLGDYFKSSYYISGTCSSAPAKFIKFLPNSIVRVLSKLETVFWRFHNNIESKPINAHKIKESTVFIFGYKKINGVLKHLCDIEFTGKIIIHLSHYHTFTIDDSYFKLFDITLAFDVEVSNCEFFLENFPKYSKKIEIIPFQISQRYSNTLIPDEKKLRLFVSGTYHKDPINKFGVSINGFYTLHPLRLKFSLLDNLPSFVVNKLSMYQSSSSFNLFKYKQKSYFSFDILKEYLASSHAFIGCEVTGAIGIGTIEAMACGCIIFITPHEYVALSKNGLNPECIIFDDIDDLYNKICQINPGHYNSSRINKEISKFYSKEYLLDEFYKKADEYV